jgi:hypothetical protein
MPVIPFFHILERLNKQIEETRSTIDHAVPNPSNDDLERMKTLESEKSYVDTEIDSLNKLLETADSVKPVGYRAIQSQKCIEVKEGSRFFGNQLINRLTISISYRQFLILNEYAVLSNRNNTFNRD